MQHGTKRFEFVFQYRLTKTTSCAAAHRGCSLKNTLSITSAVGTSSSTPALTAAVRTTTLWRSTHLGPAAAQDTQVCIDSHGVCHLTPQINVWIDCVDKAGITSVVLYSKVAFSTLEITVQIRKGKLKRRKDTHTEQHVKCVRNIC